jgi:hypothetical protein
VKNSKIKYYAKNTLKLLLPNRLYRDRLNARLAGLSRYDETYVRDRVDYYNRRQGPFTPDETFTSIRAFRHAERKTYFYDLYEYLRYFDEELRFAYLYGDVQHVPEVPTLLKSRPLGCDNANSVLLKLNKVRHFLFLNDPIPFSEKADRLVWRGGAYQPHRQRFVREFFDHPLCDVGQTNKPKEDVPWQKKKMSIRAQLGYKFIFSIEGNDVATNLKWIMSSNSLAFMPRPKFETWFMEGRLVPDHHYVLVRDDLSDLEEKIRYYTAHPEEAMKIIKNANDYVAQFMDAAREDLIALLVLKKYFHLSGQR